jgi:hypothetical protein
MTDVNKYSNVFRILPGLFVLMSLGCSPYIVSDAVDAEPIGIYSVSCSKPYEFSRDCDGPPPWADLPVMLGDYPFNIAATEDGTVMLIERCKHSEKFCPIRSPKNSHTENTRDIPGAYMAAVFDAVKAELADQGVVVRTARPIIASFPAVIGRTTTRGYLLELDGDGYAVLSKYSLRPAQETPES